jgi:hypothetical protein
MKLSSAQAQCLLQIAIDSIKLCDNSGNIFIFDDKVRRKLVNDIIQQQDKNIEETDKT